MSPFSLAITPFKMVDVRLPVSAALLPYLGPFVLILGHGRQKVQMNLLS